MNLRLAAALPFALTKALCEVALDKLLGKTDPLEEHIYSTTPELEEWWARPFRTS